MSWSNRYLDIEFAEHGRGPDKADCWGLVHMVLRDIFGIKTRDMSSAYADVGDRSTIATLFDDCPELTNWQTVDEPQEGDLLVFNILGKPLHIGIVVLPGFFLHIRKGVNSCVESYTVDPWKRRVARILRHRSRL